MKTCLMVLFFVCVGFLAGFSAGADVPPPSDPTPLHTAWQRIHYLEVPMPDTPGRTMSFELFNGGLGDIPYPPESSRLRFDMTFGRNLPDDAAERGWGKAAVVVDDQAWDCLIPSSLFCTSHGRADPNNPQRLCPPTSPGAH